MFLQAVRGAVEPALWEAWWDAHAEQLKAHLSLVISCVSNPAGRWITPPCAAARKGSVLFFTGRDILWKTALTHYKIKAEEEFKRRQEKRLQDYYERISSVMDAWEAFLAKHPVAPVASTGKRGWGRRRDRLRIRLRRFLIHPAKFRPCLIRFWSRPGAPASILPQG